MAANVDNLLEFDGDDDAIEGKYDDISGLQDDIDSELAQMFADFDGGDLDQLEVRVYRAREGKGKLSYVFACLPSELPILDKLRDEYGGGDFEVRLLKNKKIFRRFQVSVEAPIKTVGVGASSESASISSAMTQGFTRLGELMITMNKPVEPPNPMGMVEIQAGMMQNMLAMKEIMGGGQRQQSPISQLKELMELKKMVVGDDDTEKEANTNDVLVALIQNVMPALGSLGASESHSQSQSQSQSQPKTPKGKSIINTGQEQKEQEDVQPLTEEQKKMKVQLMYLCSMAKKDVDPAPYAQMTVDNTPPEKLGELLEYITDEKGAIDGMIKVHAKVGEYRDWFVELGECIKLILTDDGNESTLEGEIIAPEGSNVPIAESGNTPFENETSKDNTDGDTVGKVRDAGDPENHEEPR